VTHQGSGLSVQHDQIGSAATVSPSLCVVVVDNDPSLVSAPSEQLPIADEPSARCSGCGSPRARAVRQGWLRHRISHPMVGWHAATPWSGLIHDSC
jgi:hypothetical protein